jgi:hypothetical protein
VYKIVGCKGTDLLFVWRLENADIDGASAGAVGEAAAASRRAFGYLDDMRVSTIPNAVPGH